MNLVLRGFGFPAYLHLSPSLHMPTCQVELHLLVHHFRDDTGGAVLDERFYLN